jgi:Asp-tRNA(Asn)/Glu-tRNA(Gln) amidotransferase A subunit family amidase
MLAPKLDRADARIQERAMTRTTTDPKRRSFHDAARAFAAGSDTPRAYLERCLERIAELEPKVSAFVALDPKRARDAADRSNERWRAGRALSPIDGMPVGIKDIIETEDMPTGQGSPIFAGYRTGRDAATVVALKEAGAVVVGKTVTTEFASSEPLGATRNPWDLDRTPGGSSSGSAASVAVGMLPCALGTQVLGSILRPASYCGVYGFKPSVGAINRGGSYDGFSQSCDGALAASLDDAWLTLREISARVGGDPGFPGLSGPRTVPEAKTPARLALLETAGWAVAGDEVKSALAAAAQKLKAAGVAILTRRERPEIEEAETAISSALRLSRAINDWEGRWPVNAYRDKPGLSEAMQNRLKHAEAMSLEEYQGLLADRARVRAVYARLKTVVEGCITLSAPAPAPLGLRATGDPIFVVAGSLLGVPALSLPRLQAERLPLGLQVLGFEQEDAAAMALARAIDAMV